MPLNPAVVELPAGMMSVKRNVLFPVKSTTRPVAPEVAPVTNSSTEYAVPFQDVRPIVVA